MLRNLGAADACILELGAGSGVMAADLLAELERQGALPAQYWILDLSADLRERQRATLEQAVPHLLERVAGSTSCRTRPLRGVIVANEVLDALTVQRFAIRDGHVNALGVSMEFGQLVLAEVRGGERLVNAVRAIERETGVTLPDDYESEVCIGLDQWLAAIGASLERGVMLFIDYGLPGASTTR